MAKSNLVTAAGLGKHLDLSRQRIMQLVEEQVIERRPDGRFDQDACRLRYIRFVREAGRRATSSIEQARLIDAKVRAVELSNAQKDGRLCEVAEAEAFVAECLGAFRADMNGFAAAVTRDVALRRRIDARLDEIFKASSDRLALEAAKLRAPASR